MPDRSYDNSDERQFKEKAEMQAYQEIGNHNLFMMCEKKRTAAFRDLPEGYWITTCTKDRFSDWLAVAVDARYRHLLLAFYQQVYAAQEDTFLKRCYLVYDQHHTAVATALLWKAYGQFESLGWVRTLPAYEGRGIGRGLLSAVLSQAEAPIYLHTQPTSITAISLYLDLGFVFLDDPRIGMRSNDVFKDQELLEKLLDRKLPFKAAPASFIQALKDQKIDEL